jgi:hypothetical protein
MTSRINDETPDFGTAARKIKPGLSVLRFRIELPLQDEERSVLVWRIIEVPQDYTFWDLHVAIQDAMGWADYHLHEFAVPTNLSGPGTVKVGIPIDQGDFPEVSASDGTLVYLAEHLKVLAKQGMVYLYDFGDGWRHWITLEGIVDSDGGLYPRCIGGENACPPEDCGGESGYFSMLDVLKDRTDPEHRDTKTWLRYHVNVNWPYRPDRFSVNQVRFDDPAKRLEYAMSND